MLCLATKSADNSDVGSVVIILNSCGDNEEIKSVIPVGLVAQIFSVKLATILVKNLNIRSIHITPKTLNMRWANAARFADMFAEKAAMLAVMVVPMFSPIIIAAADSNPIQPREHMMSVMATVALDDCTIIVNTVPISKKISVERNPKLAKSLTNASTSGLFCKSGIESFRKSSPINKKANPKINSPKDLRLLFAENMRGSPTPSNGMDMMLMENLPKPNKDIIHAVTVVPILAPMITPIDWAKVSKPAFTKLTTITLAADED